ncbi:MAG: hypothetical protein ABSC17_05710 [Thermacetogeniaceae bacterium]
MNTFIFIKALSRDIQLWRNILSDANAYAVAYAPDNADRDTAQAPEYFSARSDAEAEQLGRQKAVEQGWATAADFPD